MRKSLVMLATFFLLFLLATPALADVNLNINGKSYQPTIQPRIEEGSTLVPVYLAGRVLGAEITVSDQNVNITNNGQTLTLTQAAVQKRMAEAIIDRYFKTSVPPKGKTS